MRVALLATLAFLIGCVETAPESTDGLAAPSPLAANEPFRTVAQRHFEAIQQRDLPTLMGTVTTGDSLTLIFPDGTLIRTRQEFEDIHTQWFADTTWTMTIDPLVFRESPELSYALVRTTLEDDTPASGRQAYLVLTFANEGGEWRLVHDQNTRIQPPE